MKVYEILRKHVNVCMDDEYYSTYAIDIFETVSEPVTVEQLRDFVFALRSKEEKDDDEKGFETLVSVNPKIEIKNGKVISFCSAPYEYGEEEWWVVEKDISSINDVISEINRKAEERVLAEKDIRSACTLVDWDCSICEYSHSCIRYNKDVNGLPIIDKNGNVVCHK